MRTFLSDNTKFYKVARTIAEGIISVLMTELPDILGLLHVDPALQAILIPLFMTILTPIFAYLGEMLEEDALDAGGYEVEEEALNGEDEELDEEEDA